MFFLLSVLLLGTPSQAAEGTVDDAVELLSRYPVGHVPVEIGTLAAIHVIGASGGRAEVGVLRSLAEHERSDVRVAAMEAIDAVRARQRAQQRREFAESIPDEAGLQAASAVWTRVGLQPASAQAAVYAGWVLGDEAAHRPGARAGDARRFLASGQPRKALAALAAEGRSEGDLALLATAREDAGDVRGALRVYTVLALSGDADANLALRDHQLDVERMFVGLLVMEQQGPVGDEEARLLKALVEQGGVLTVACLTERLFEGGGSERASAADGLIRMLEREDLGSDAREKVRAALVRAVNEGPAPVRDIAASGL
ncbi:MAG: hypothetical protein KC912_07110 [Proteobacteria bacterium]|nr:hypothetical protein [Pseudomonadota bacterium]